MPSFRIGTVDSVLEGRAGLQRVLVSLGEATEPERAYVLTMLTGAVAPGDRVVVNTTAVDLGLGTGGWHVVHWNLERTEWHQPGPGHVLKRRYTSFQSDVGSTEEHSAELTDVVSIDGMPVVAAALHSQLPGIAVALKHARPDLRVAYVMTDAAALPIAVSDLVAALCDRAIIDVTITCGHAFGGDYEAVSVYSALAVARHVAGADVAIVVMGPGIVGTATRLGFSGIELGPILDAAAGLGGVPIACLRASFADERERHCGVSHHALTALTVACRSHVQVALPAVGGEAEKRLRDDLERAGIDRLHDIIAVEPPDILELFAVHGLEISSMGRPAAADPILYQSAAAAGTLAAQTAPPARARTGAAMSAGPNRVERMLNLLACLLDTRRPLTRDELVRQVSGYPAEPVAYRRSFERDKETLRAMGVPLVVETLPSGEQGYRVPPDEYFLPDLGLTAEETAALHVAVSAVLLGGESGHGALMKLGGSTDAPTTPIGTLPLEPALPVLFEAFRRRAAVTFEYRGESRTVEPWGLAARRGHWYLVGRDRDRDAMRTFRADRLGDDVTVGAPDSFAVPDDFSADASLDSEPWQYGEGPAVTARLLVDAGHGSEVAERGDRVIEERADGSLVVEFVVANRHAFRSFVLGFLDHAEILEPEELRADLLAWIS